METFLTKKNCYLGMLVFSLIWGVTCNLFAADLYEAKTRAYMEAYTHYLRARIANDPSAPIKLKVYNRAYQKYLLYLQKGQYKKATPERVTTLPTKTPPLLPKLQAKPVPAPVQPEPMTTTPMVMTKPGRIPLPKMPTVSFIPPKAKLPEAKKTGRTIRIVNPAKAATSSMPVTEKPLDTASSSSDQKSIATKEKADLISEESTAIHVSDDEKTGQLLPDSGEKSPNDNVNIPE